MSQKTTVSLDYPVEINGATVGVIQIRRASAADVLAVNKLNGNDADRAVRIIANLTEWAPDDILKLDMCDFVKVQEVVEGFIGRSPKA